MRLLIPLLLFTLAACSPVFKLSTSQGNAIDQKKLDQVTLGMNGEQVRYLLGTPLVADEFQPNRWDYVSYFRAGDGSERKRIISLYFENGRLVSLDDSNPPQEPASEDAPATAN